MLLLFGLSRKVHQLGAVVLTCGSCGRSGPHALLRCSSRFTVFFVPVLPLRSRHETRCPWCGAVGRLGRDEARRLAGSAA